MQDDKPILPGDDIIQQYAQDWLKQGGVNDVKAFAEWLDKTIDNTFLPVKE